MFTGNSEVMVRKGNKIFSTTVKQAAKMDNVSLFCMTGKTKFDFMPLENVEVKRFDEVVAYDLIIENNKGARRKVTCTEDQQVLTTVRQMCSVLRLNQLDVMVDDEGYPNKIISLEERKLKNVDMYSLELKYSNSPFVNGITLSK
jgi:hypothetical protein